MCHQAVIARCTPQAMRLSSTSSRRSDPIAGPFMVTISPCNQLLYCPSFSPRMRLPRLSELSFQSVEIVDEVDRLERVNRLGRTQDVEDGLNGHCRSVVQ